MNSVSFTIALCIAFLFALITLEMAETKPLQQVFSTFYQNNPELTAARYDPVNNYNLLRNKLASFAGSKE